jgi:hypothetical protein
MNPRRAFLIVFLLLLLGLGIAWGIQWYQRRKAMEDAIAQAPTALRSFTANLQAVRFVRVDGDVLTFAWLEQVERGGQQYVEQVEHQARIVNLDSGVARATKPSLAFSELERDQEIRVDMETDPTDPSRFVINAAFLIE